MTLERRKRPGGPKPLVQLRFPTGAELFACVGGVPRSSPRHPISELALWPDELRARVKRAGAAV